MIKRILIEQEHILVNHLKVYEIHDKKETFSP